MEWLYATDVLVHYPFRLHLLQGQLSARLDWTRSRLALTRLKGRLHPVRGILGTYAARPHAVPAVDHSTDLLTLGEFGFDLPLITAYVILRVLHRRRAVTSPLHALWLMLCNP